MLKGPRAHCLFCLSNHDNRLLPEEFVCWTRRFLQLPPLTRLGNALPRVHYDFDMEECLGDHNEAEDSWLAHLRHT